MRVAKVKAIHTNIYAMTEAANVVAHKWQDQWSSLWGSMCAPLFGYFSSENATVPIFAGWKCISLIVREKVCDIDDIVDKTEGFSPGHAGIR